MRSPNDGGPGERASSSNEENTPVTNGAPPTGTDSDTRPNVLRSAILNALLEDVGGNGIPSEQHQQFRQTIFQALKQDLTPSAAVAGSAGGGGGSTPKSGSTPPATEPSILSQNDDGSKDSVADQSTGESLLITPKTIPHAAMIKSLETIEGKVMMPAPQSSMDLESSALDKQSRKVPSIKRPTIASTLSGGGASSKGLQQLESDILQKSQTGSSSNLSTSGGTSRRLQQSDALQKSQVGSSSNLSANAGISARGLQQLETDVLQKSQVASCHAVASVPSSTEKKNEERILLGVGAYAVAGDGEHGAATLPAASLSSNLQQLESDVLSKMNSSRTIMTTRSRSAVSLMSLMEEVGKQESSSLLCDSEGLGIRDTSLKRGGSNRALNEMEDEVLQKSTLHIRAPASRRSSEDAENNDDVESGVAESSLSFDQTSDDTMSETNRARTEATNMGWRAIGERPSWAGGSNQFSASDPSLISHGTTGTIIASRVVADDAPATVVIVAESVKKENPRKKYYKWLFLVGGALFATLVVGLSVGLTVSDNNGDSPVMPQIDVCLDSPDVLTQCKCNSSIYYLPEERVVSYDNITVTLIDTGIYINPSISRLSCDPTVVARFWLIEQVPLSRLELHQMYALSVFYLSLNGNDWSTNWWMNNTKTNVCDDWSGIICTNAGVVKEIQLASANLRGELPQELSILSDMRAMEVNNNQITGTLPSSMITMSLRRLAIEENKLVGPFRPTLLSPMSTILRLNKNMFTGTIPTEVGNLSRLRRLQLNGNQMTGTLPTEISNLASLLVLYLDGNEFVGPTPEQYGILSNLEEMILSNNTLTGTLPESYSNLTKMITMAIDNNDFEGTVPEQYCDSFEALEQLVGDCTETFSANCTCCTCWTGDLQEDDRRQ